MGTIDEKRRQRFQFLHLVYEKTDGNRLHSVNMYELGKELGWADEITRLVVQYLVGEGLVEHFTMGGNIVIKHSGVVEIERALTRPEEPTTYFPAVINVVSGDFRGAILNIDSTLTDLSQSIGKLPSTEADVKEELQQLINQLKQALEEVPSEKVEEAEAVAQAAESFVEAATKETPNEFTVEITKEGLQKAAQNIALVMPTVLTIATQIITAISKLR